MLRLEVVLIGVKMEVGVRPVLLSMMASKLRMPLEGVSIGTPSMCPPAAGFNDKETGLCGLWMEVTKGVGSTTWTWTNSVSGFASKVGGSTLTMTSLTTSPWSLQEDL